MTDFAGRHVVITGASSGIGRATSQRVVAGGGTVTLIARRAALLEEAVAELGGAAGWAVADVADKPQLLAALDAAVAARGAIDGLFCNAGIGGTFAAGEDYGDAAFAAVMAGNVT
ncbi:SDR family oxidoreductase, partial [Novosphingobium sp. B-7]|uniref:SDR family oxidoreductase n=1 Tax=Novosphingobium sp. B-7 TaxID=1298855 RepID=UPI001ED99C92